MLKRRPFQNLLHVSVRKYAIQKRILMANIPHEVESCCRLCGTVLAFHLDTVQPLALMNALKSRQKAANYYAILKHPVQHIGQVQVTRARGALLHHHGQYHSSHTPALHHPISQGHSLHLFHPYSNG